MEKNESLMGRRSTPTKGQGPLVSENRSSSTGQASNSSVHEPVDSLGRQNLASAIDQHGSGRRSLSESLLTHPNPGNISLRKQLHIEEDRVVVKITKNSEDENSSQVSRTVPI